MVTEINLFETSIISKKSKSQIMTNISPNFTNLQAQNVQWVWETCSKVRDVDRLTP